MKNSEIYSKMFKGMVMFSLFYFNTKKVYISIEDSLNYRLQTPMRRTLEPVVTQTTVHSTYKNIYTYEQHL